jgi:hypothetical protein
MSLPKKKLVTRVTNEMQFGRRYVSVELKAFQANSYYSAMEVIGVKYHLRYFL